MYSQIFQSHADLLKALAHPRRLEIIHLLRDQELPVTSIHTMLDLPQANVSQHLTILRDLGVVTTRKTGKSIFYSIKHPQVLTACDLLREVLIKQHHSTHLADQMVLKMSDLLPIVKDPVCQMRLSPKTAGFHTRHENQEYYFCASGCYGKFNQEPHLYV